MANSPPGTPPNGASGPRVGVHTPWSSDTAEWSKRPAGRRPHTLVFVVGDDANMPLLQLLAANNGYVELVRSTEPIDFKLSAFLDKVGAEPVQNLSLAVTPRAIVDLVYPLEDSRYAGSMATWAGRYQTPLPHA